MEFFVVYDEASGAVLWVGQGPAGTGIGQALPAGAKVAIVTQQVIATPGQVDLAATRALVKAAIDVGAENFRSQFITAGSGQALTYQYKVTEAATFASDPNKATPFVDAEASARGMTRDAVVAEINNSIALWTSIGSKIEGLRLGAKAKVDAATVFGTIVDAGLVDWTSASSSPSTTG